MKKSIITVMLLGLMATPNMLSATALNESWITYEEELPSAYDGRSYCSTVKNQENDGTCWIYLSNSLLETSLMKTFGILDPTFYNFSECDMDQRTSSTYGRDYGFERECGDFGCFSMALSYWTRGELNGSIQEGMSQKSPYYVKQTANIEAADSEQYIQQIKELVYRYGGVTASYYSSEYSKGQVFYSRYPYAGNTDLAYYYPGNNAANHGSIIVGWDDAYSKEHFNPACRPKQDGAFLVKNSWGTQWGQGGYFWISYETPIADINAIVEVSEDSFFDTIYETDKHGLTGGMSASQESHTNAYMNTYQTKSSKESLTALSTYVMAADSRFKLYVSQDGDTAHLKEVKVKNSGTYQNGYLVEYEGYKTFELEEPLNINGKCLVAIEVTTPEKGVNSIPVEMNMEGYCNNISASLKRGYIAKDIASLKRNMTYDIGQKKANICLKAFTKKQGN